MLPTYGLQGTFNRFEALPFSLSSATSRLECEARRPERNEQPGIIQPILGGFHYVFNSDEVFVHKPCILAR